MCRTLTALGVLYHNYRIVITPPPSQEGLYRMHGRGMQGKGVEVERGGGGGVGRSLAVMERWESVQCN